MTTDTMPGSGITGSGRPAFAGDNKLKLGLFGANMSCQTALTTIPERWIGDWDENVEVAELADGAGLEFILPVSRWKGYAGKVDPAGVCNETIAWATGLLAKTKRLTVFATVQAPLIHPVFAAKQFATADQIGHGRFGLNIVVGWNDQELEMFGNTVPAPDRYPYTREWVEIIRRIWAGEDEFDFNGRFFQLRGLRGKPFPYGGTRPLLVNAGMSDVGRAFAMDCCDCWFSTPPSPKDDFSQSIAEAKAPAAARGIDYPVLTSSTVICRSTKREAEEFYRYVCENADWEAVDRVLEIRRLSGRKLPEGDKQQQRQEMLKGFGSFIIVGDPDHVASEFARLNRQGIDGIAMIFVNQKREVPFFLQEVAPRLQAMGLRS
ncbi:LLM class flavin-dependent oxidoreductase [Hyphomicrobiales bacterium]|nr:LLM class flavin-dependent oxidoreductase [Hyphomicrobiales bacterium]CAH1691373.1 LLM class flavin-dependent oxidoreductase [Hyphomicrobiales bacterium]